MLDKERHLLFSLNLLDEMQDRFGGFDKLSEALNGADMMKNLRWLLTRLLNEGAAEDEEELEEMRVGKLIHAGNLLEVKNTIFAAFAVGTQGDEAPDDPAEDEAEEPGDGEAPEDGDGKNTKGGRGKK